MTSDQIKNVAQVYRRFLASEEQREEDWTGIDDYMEQLESLGDDQLHREADVLFTQHKRGTPSCGQNHPSTECFIVNVVDAVEAIIEQYKETGNLHKNNKYVLQYYLAINQAGMIHL